MQITSEQNFEKALLRSYSFKRTFQKDGKDKHIFTVTFNVGNDTLTGDFFSDSNPPELKEGEQYPIKVKPSSDPSKYAPSVALVKPKSFGKGGGGYKRNERAENARTALICAKDMVISGKAEAKLLPTFQAFFNLLNDNSQEQ